MFNQSIQILASRAFAAAALAALFIGAQPLPSAVAATPSAVLLASKYDQCDAPFVRVFGTPIINVAKGQTKTTKVTQVFRWLCGNAGKVTQCPITTNFIVLYRRPTGNAMLWRCFHT